MIFCKQDGDKEHRLLTRSLRLIVEVDIVVSLFGHFGTLWELLAAIMCGKPLCVGEFTGGASASLRSMVESLGLKSYDPSIHYAESDDDLLRCISTLLQRRRT